MKNVTVRSIFHFPSFFTAYTQHDIIIAYFTQSLHSMQQSHAPRSLMLTMERLCTLMKQLFLMPLE